jgi:sugar-specific transcriptional regulator TrmB
MYTDLLQELGLSPNETKIYEALLTYGGSGVSTIAIRSKIHRRNVYDAIHRLLEKGLVCEVQGKGEIVYEPVEPSKLLEMAEEKVRKVEIVLPKMMSTFHAKKTPERSYVYKGIEGVKNYLRETLATGEDVFTFGGKGAWFDPKLQAYTATYLEEAKRRSMKIHVLFDHEAADDIPDIARRFSRSKFLPEGYSTQSAIDVFGDNVVTFSQLNGPSWTEDVTVFVTVSPKLAEAYRTWWKLLWDLLPDAPKARKRE